MSKVKSFLADNEAQEIYNALDDIMESIYAEEARVDAEEEKRGETVFTSMVQEFLK